MSDHEEIYLEPLFEPRSDDEQDWYDIDGRQWCEDDVWCDKDYHGVGATKYLRADLCETEMRAMSRRHEEIEALLKLCISDLYSDSGKFKKKTGLALHKYVNVNGIKV